MMPIVNGLEDEFAGEVDVMRLSAAEGENAALQDRYGLRGHPSFAVLGETGVVVERFYGPQSADILREAMVRVQTK